MSDDITKISWIGKTFSQLFMRIFFKSVRGWKKRVPDNTRYFVEAGIDGSCLEGTIQESENPDTKGVIILCHPFLKYGMHYFFKNNMDLQLLSQGFHVISFNFKGFGCSTLKGHAYSDDVLSIGYLIQRNYPNLPIHLLGCSFGGFHLCHALMKDAAPFASVVLDSVPCSVNAFFKNGILATAMKWASNSKFSQSVGVKPISHSLERIGGLPVLYLYGDMDKYISQLDIDNLKRKCKGLDFARFSGCGHLEIYKKKKQCYIRIIVAYFTDNRPSKIEK
ncbi:hypothetical protein MNBD_GAMMA20-383 [hydrothermal vent metagenome]|uniref:AB hydrolase-1 domain-containing protein n=1 Tax=hydrothermal vent metagenome TaxID=652676 RepID=A0A3B1A2G9_9ZZZZ